MRKYTVSKPNACRVACVEEMPENPEKIVIAVHGFTSSKESATVQLLLHKLPGKALGVVGIDLPGHGKEESLWEELRLEACLESISRVEKDLTERFPGVQICYFASSFGAYCTALYISTRPHKGRRAFFRSAAVNMPSLFIKEDPSEEEKQFLRELDEKGFVMASFDLGQSVRVTRGFIDDLAGHDLFSLFDPEKYGHHRIAMAHGAEDTVIDPAKAEQFAKTFGIPETVFAGEGHSLGNDPGTPDKVADLAAALYLAP